MMRSTITTTLYPVTDAGKWSIQKHPDSIDFIQELSSAGYDYVYRKTVPPGAGQTGDGAGAQSAKPRSTRHPDQCLQSQFLVLDNQPPGPGLDDLCPLPD